jgi:hypothetical protein
MAENPPLLISITLAQYEKGLQSIEKRTDLKPIEIAQLVIGMTIRLLNGRGEYDRITEALNEAQLSIWRETKTQTVPWQRQRLDMVCSAIVSLLNEEEGVPLEDAAKRICGNDTAEVKRLLAFRNNLKHKKKLKDEYFSFKTRMRQTMKTYSHVTIDDAVRVARNRKNKRKGKLP